jgi:hypothetical protein
MPLSASPEPSRAPEGLFDSDDPSLVESTPRASKAVLDHKDTAAESVQSASAAKAAASGRKIMDQAQFKAYREAKEIIGDDQESDSGASDEEYEDETERNKELQRQRRKQEGDLAVWRQQMQKVTGEKSQPLQRLDSQTPSLDPNALAPGMAADEHDSDSSEEIPLGVLMAHGFPSKTRPPSKIAPGPFASKLPNESYSDMRLSADQRSLSAGNIRPGTSPAPPTSVAGGKRGALPPFARNLPSDPYFGASLHNGANRESLAFGNSSAASVYNGQSSGGNIGNQTLVNVIASEERAKAMRRGSPNAQAGFGPNTPSHAGPNQMNPMQMQMAMGMPMGNMHAQPQSMDPLMLQQLLVNQQQQMQQLSQMMTQVMSGGMAMNPQMMMQMQQMGMPMQQPQMGMPSQNQFLSPNMNHQGMGRPMSTYSQPGHQQRAMSMVNIPQLPTIPQQQHGYTPSVHGMRLGLPNGYTPSIAPSERSTVGMASRYRPVTHNLDGASTVSTTTPASSFPTQVQAVDDPSKAKKKSSILGVLKRGNNKENQHQDDEDEGWGEMPARKSKWKGEKTSSPGIRELYVGESI